MLDLHGGGSFWAKDRYPTYGKDITVGRKDIAVGRKDIAVGPLTGKMSRLASMLAFPRPSVLLKAGGAGGGNHC